MKKPESKNIAASANQRLLNIAKRQNESFDQILMRYGLERFLYRLSISKYKDQFLLKGALLFTIWTNQPHRPTRDIDLLGFCDSELATLEKIFHEICSINADDGLSIDVSSIKISEIKENDKYQGTRIKFLAKLDQARIHLQVNGVRPVYLAV